MNKESQEIVERRSRMLRRSGVGFYSVAQAIGWSPDCVIQAGVGQHHQEVDVLLEASRFHADWTDLSGHFYGCEPHPTVFKQLKGQYPGTLHNVAAGAKAGKAVFYNRSGHKDGSSLFLHKDTTDDGIRYEVLVARLDDLFEDQCRKYQRILLWLDCEGSELDAMFGAPSLLQKAQVVNIEVTPRARGADWADPVEVHEYLIAAGYWALWCHTQRCSHGQCDWVYVKPEIFSPDHCCIPQELARWREWILMHGDPHAPRPQGVIYAKGGSVDAG